MNWDKAGKEADYVTDKTIREEPSLAKEYYNVLNTHKLKKGYIFVSLALLNKKALFMTCEFEPKSVVTFEGKIFESVNRLHVKTKNNGVQTIHFYKEFEIKPLS